MTTEQHITPTLQMLKGDTPGRLFELNRPVTTIGRRSECDIFLGHETVSKRHARILQRADGLYLEDWESRNGVQVDGKYVKAPVRLQDGNHIQICDFLFIFHSPVIRIQGDSDNSTTILGMLDLATPADPMTVGVNAKQKLDAILELTRNLGNTLDLGEILETTLETLFNFFPQADRGFVLLKDERARELTPKAIKYRPGVSANMTISRTIFDHVMNHRRAILSMDAEADSRFKASQSIADSKIRTVMCVPLLDQQRNAMGIIQIDTYDRRTHFGQEDLDLMVSVAGPAQVSVENAWLHESLVRQKEMEEAFRNAREVQKALLPQQFPQVQGYQFWAYYEPALHVGGDYYDFIPVGPGDGSAGPSPAGVRQWAVTVGDVAGKGMPAALLMAKLASEVRLFMAADPNPPRVVERLNQTLAVGGMQDHFVTFQLVLIDCDTHQASIVSAGHMGPLVRRASGTIEVIGDEESGPPLAVISGQSYRTARTRLDPGEVLVLYTDGVTDAVGPSGRRFSLDRLKQVLLESSGTATRVGEAIIEAVRRHADGHSQADDITLVCIGRS